MKGGYSQGQVWVETVIYTLIALVIIGLVLSFVQPKILELQDKATLQQSISILNNIDNIVSTLSQNGAGNTRRIDLNLKAGSLTIDGTNDSLSFSIDKSRFQFSEPDKPVNFGNIVVYTHTVNDLSSINMTLDYTASYNITYSGQKIKKIITQATTPYNLLISNLGGNKTQIDFQLG